MNDNNQGYNNNQNRPLFDGAFNNVPNKVISNNNNQMMQNGYPQQNFNPMVEQSGQLFQQNFNQPQINEQSDMPPALDSIKNLSDMISVQAPTLDVLGPMNIMPENTAPQDPIAAYETSDFSFNNLPQQQVLATNQFNSLPQNDFTNQFNQPVPNYVTPELNNQNAFNSQTFNNINPIYPNLTTSQSVQTVNQDNLFDQNYVAQPINQYNTNALPITNANQPQVFQTPDYNMVSNLDAVALPEINNTISLNENNYVTSPTVVSDNVSESYGVSEPIDNNYLVVNESLNEDQTETEDLSSLGLDASYNEPDTLEIMDIENDEDLDSGEDLVSTVDSVNKVKKLIQELKQDGSNIELEEFDFETMYQIIIKINK